jgi:hypothetical protein
MAAKSVQVGDIVESTCRKCNDITGHAIVSILDGQIAKVECRGCGSVHKYRPGPKAASPKTQTSSSASPTHKKTSPKGKKGLTAKEKEAQQLAEQWYEEWQRKIENKDPAEAKSYSMDNQYQADDLIDHASFGLGIVQRTIPPNKMDVLFHNGEKRLRCAQVPNPGSSPLH